MTEQTEITKQTEKGFSFSALSVASVISVCSVFILLFSLNARIENAISLQKKIFHPRSYTKFREEKSSCSFLLRVFFVWLRSEKLLRLIALFSILCVTVYAQTPPDPNLLAAESYLQQKKFAKAIEALDLVFQVQPNPPDAAFGMMATAQLNVGNKAQALTVTERGLAMYPASTKLAEFYVALLGEVATADETKSKLEKMVERQPRSIVFRKALARLLSNSSAKAEALFDSLTKDLPRDAEAHFLFAQWACVNDKYNLCVSESTKAIALSGRNLEALMQLNTLRAIAHETLNHIPQAEAAYRQALAANRKLSKLSPDAYFKYVAFLVKHNRDPEAQTLNDELLKRSPDFGEAHFERAKWLVKQKRNKEALTSANRALSLLEKEPKQAKAIHAFLAKTYFALDQMVEAEFHQKAVEAIK